MQDLNDMFLFAKVVEHGGYSAAARALKLQTSMLSRRVQQLEERLGVRLLQRTTRAVSVTEIGQAYYRHCAALEAEALAAQDTIDRTRASPQGLIHVACPIGVVESHVAGLIARYLDANPGVQVRLEATNRRVDVVEEGFDLAVRVRMPPLEASELAMRSLGFSHRTLVASPAFIAKHGCPTHPRELANLPTVAGTLRGGGKHIWHFRSDDGSYIEVTHQPRLISDDFKAQVQAAIAGVGAAYLPDTTLRGALEAGALLQLLPDFILPEELIHVVFPSRRGMVPAVREFIDVLVQGFAAHNLTEQDT
jgi:DNA-binding transcriptional LysR family regulator